MKRVKRCARRTAAALLCLGLLNTGALADVTTPVTEEEPKWEEQLGAVWETNETLPAPFSDVPENADYARAVAVLAQMGILTGDHKGNFNPNDTINRAETAAIICRVVGVEEDAKALETEVFTDVPATHWAVGYVAMAAELGIINGYGNGTFGPGDPVTYAQMVKMLVCAWGWDEVAEKKGGWPGGYIQAADEYGYTEGITHNTNDVIARSVVARLVYNSFGG